MVFLFKKVHPLSLLGGPPALVPDGSNFLLILGYVGAVQRRTGARAAERGFKSFWQLPS